MNQEQRIEDEVDLMDYLNVILKRKLLIFLVFVLAMVGAGVFSYPKSRADFPIDHSKKLWYKYTRKWRKGNFFYLGLQSLLCPGNKEGKSWKRENILRMK